MITSETSDFVSKYLPTIILGVIVSWKVVDAITSRLKSGKNKEALKLTAAVCVIVLMMGITVTLLSLGFHIIPLMQGLITEIGSTAPNPPPNPTPSPTPAARSEQAKNRGQRTRPREQRIGPPEQRNYEGATLKDTQTRNLDCNCNGSPKPPTGVEATRPSTALSEPTPPTLSPGPGSQPASPGAQPPGTVVDSPDSKKRDPDETK